jgi:hypothetical protein
MSPPKTSFTTMAQENPKTLGHPIHHADYPHSRKATSAVRRGERIGFESDGIVALQNFEI